MSAAAKLCGFLLLLAVIFAAAYLAGARLGPVAPAGGSMNMGSAVPHARGVTP